MTQGELTGREVWERFCEDLKLAGAVLDDPSTPRDGVTQAEGVRCLARLIAMGMEVALEHADGEHPWVFLARIPTKLSGGVSPDAIYHEAFIDGMHTYRIVGTRGTAPMLEIGVYAGKLGLQEQSRLIGQICEDDINVDVEGRFEVVLSADPRRNPTIVLEPDASYIYIRNYSLDWTRDTAATFTITADDITELPAPLSLDAIDHGLDGAQRYVREVSRAFAATIGWNKERATNTLVPIDPAQPTSMPGGHLLACGYFALQPGEALTVTFDPATAPYWSLGLCNHWMEPMDWRWRTSSINKRSARPEPDGTVTVGIGPNAGLARNWLDTAGHPEGLMIFRWARTEDPLPVFTVTTSPH